MMSGWMAMAGIGAGLATPAMAHMPQLVPSLFDVGKRDHVTIEAAFTEDAFRAEIAMKDAPFEVTGPDGATMKLAAPTLLADMALVEAKLPADGIYRLSSGQRLGRIGKMYKAGDAWKIVGEDGDAPAAATLVAVQSTTLADAYVLRGKPGATNALAARDKALEIHPLGDPTSIGAGEPASFEILYNGKALAGETVSLFRERGFYDGKKQVAEIASDKAGKVSFTPVDAGRYLLLVRHRDAAPAGAGAPYYSYTVTLTFEAM